MGLRIGDIILAGLSVLSFVLAFISEEYRLIAIIFAFVLLILLLISFQFLEFSSLKKDLLKEISELKNGQKRNSERLKIYERLAKLEVKFDIIKNGE